MHPTKESLVTLIEEARKGHVVLPEFQRSFIWDRQSIEEVLVSILNDYFIGSLLILNVLPEDHPFKARKVEGIDGDQIYAKKMVLDGQQRLTSVHYALFGPDVPLKGTRYPYRFFLNIPAALRSNWEDAVFSKPTYYSDTEELFENVERQHEEDVLSFAALQDWPTWTRWYDAYRDHHKSRGDYAEKNSERLQELAIRFLQFQVAMVELPQGTELETVVEIFERINRTGEDLSIFELLTARLWMDDVNLRALWDETRSQHPLIDQMAAEKGERYPKFILQVLSLLRGRECKRKELILLDGKEFPADWYTAAEWVERSLRRMRSTSNGGYGVRPSQSLPYSTMIPPLAAMLRAIDLRQDEDPGAYAKVHRWYWSSVFRQRYGGSTDTLIVRDYQEVLNWLEDEESVPEAVVTDGTVLDRNLKNIVRHGAIYKGILSLVALEGAVDLYSGDAIEHHDLDDHHIFPKSVLRSQGFTEADERNTILNRTLISRITNQKLIRDKKPSLYVAEMERRHGTDGTRRILATHFIDADGYRALSRDDYEDFLAARERRIKSAIHARCTGSVRSKSVESDVALARASGVEEQSRGVE